MAAEDGAGLNSVDGSDGVKAPQSHESVILGDKNDHEQNQAWNGIAG
jgi:hypothetical protein